MASSRESDFACRAENPMRHKRKATISGKLCLCIVRITPKDRNQPSSEYSGKEYTALFVNIVIVAYRVKQGCKRKSLRKKTTKESKSCCMGSTVMICGGPSCDVAGLLR